MNCENCGTKIKVKYGNQKYCKNCGYSKNTISESNYVRGKTENIFLLGKPDYHKEALLILKRYFITFWVECPTAAEFAVKSVVLSAEMRSKGRHGRYGKRGFMTVAYKRIRSYAKSMGFHADREFISAKHMDMKIFMEKKKAERKEYKYTTGITELCQVCGKEFILTHSQKTHKKNGLIFCSQSCGALYREEKRRENLRSGLTAKELAEKLGISERRVRQLAESFGGIRNGRRWLFPGFSR